jgi:acetyl esterase/lipase
LLLGAVVTGCSPVQLINGLSPSSHYQRTADIAYGSVVRQKLDVYSPRTAHGPSPLVVFFYGGGWRGGNKEDYEFVASSLTEAGYAVIIPDYRLFPDVVFPKFVEDGAEVVAWALHNAHDYGADADNIFLMGHSAGAHISALLVTDQRYLAEHAIHAGRLKGFIGLSGPYDFLPIESGYLLDVFPEAKRDASQPINFVTADAPPALLIHGTDDNLVDTANSKNFAKRLSEHGVEVDLKLYQGVGHAEVAAALAPPLDFTNETLADIRKFLQDRSGRAN